MHSGGIITTTNQTKGKMKYCRERAPHERRYSDMTDCIFSRPLHYDAAAITLLGGIGVFALVDLGNKLAWSVGSECAVDALFPIVKGPSSPWAPCL
jgi:hypothetical protein